MTEYYGNNDWRDYIEHSWGTKPHQKKREKEYNAWYYQQHKEEILKRQKANRPLSHEKNVTGKGKGVKRRGVAEDGASTEAKLYKDAYKAVLNNELDHPDRKIEDYRDFRVAISEEGVDITPDEAKRLFTKYKEDRRRRSGRINRAEKEAPSMESYTGTLNITDGVGSYIKKKELPKKKRRQ